MEPVVSVLSNPSPCQYLPDRLWQMRYEIVPDMGPRDCMDRLLEGWRRFGPVLFRPECPTCRMCQSLRVPVESFRFSQTQRRVWKKNAADLELRVGSPSASAAKLELFERFHRHGHETKGWPSDDGPNLDLLMANPFRTEEWTYYLGDRLIAIGYVDALPQGLSAIYCFHDPVEAKRSLGTYNILAMIAAARARGLPHVYLGYYVAGYRSLEYKGRFRPNEVIGAGGKWEPFVP
jgi:arginine-tRNA-protein transferase